jgi:hypothetical protein
LGGLFGLSLNLVILPFFMRLRSSCGYDANDVAPHCIGDEEHSPVDETDRVEAQLASGIDIIKLDHIGGPRTPSPPSGSRCRACSGWPVPWCCPIRSPSRAPAPNILILSTFHKADRTTERRLSQLSGGQLRKGWPEAAISCSDVEWRATADEDGHIASPWRYDAGACHPIQSPVLRQHANLCCA